MIGTSLAHYEILDQLGKGGMGEVFQGRDVSPCSDVFLLGSVSTSCSPVDDHSSARAEPTSFF
jgi:serine/threonine protein kinase